MAPTQKAHVNHYHLEIRWPLSARCTKAADLRYCLLFSNHRPCNCCSTICAVELLTVPKFNVIYNHQPSNSGSGSSKNKSSIFKLVFRELRESTPKTPKNYENRPRKLYNPIPVKRCSLQHLLYENLLLETGRPNSDSHICKKITWEQTRAKNFKAQ